MATADKEPTKDELSTVLNNALDTDVKWEKLTKKDLLKVYDLFSNPTDLAKKLAKGEVMSRLEARFNIGKDIVTGLISELLS